MYEPRRRHAPMLLAKPNQVKIRMLPTDQQTCDDIALLPDAEVAATYGVFRPISEVGGVPVNGRDADPSDGQHHRRRAADQQRPARSCAAEFGVPVARATSRSFFVLWHAAAVAAARSKTLKRLTDPSAL